MSDDATVADRRRPLRALFELMSSQHGVASSAQARRLGVTRVVERRLIGEGSLVQPLRGILAAGGVRPTFAAQAMAASLRPGVIAISHGAAARLHRLDGFDDHPQLDVIGPRGAHLRVEAPILAHYSRGPLERHLVRLGAVTVTSLPLTLVLLAPTLPEFGVRSVLADALNRGESIASIREVATRWKEFGRAGISELIALVDGSGTPTSGSRGGLVRTGRRGQRQPPLGG